MNCYICEPEAIDNESTCEYHRYDLQGLCEFMADKTGCNHYTESNTPLRSIETNHIPLIDGYIAGAEITYKVVKIGCNYQLIDSHKRASE